MPSAQRYSFSIKLISTMVLLISPHPAAAQQTSPLTIQQAVESAIKNYPSITVSQEQINAAAAGIQLARTAYLPRVDTLAQANRATRNNVFGLLLPQERDSFHVRPGDRVEQLRHGLGQRHRRSGHLGAFRFRSAAARAYPRRQQ